MPRIAARATRRPLPSLPSPPPSLDRGEGSRGKRMHDAGPERGSASGKVSEGGGGGGVRRVVGVSPTVLAATEGGIARSSVPTALRRSLAAAPPHPVPPPSQAPSSAPAPRLVAARWKGGKRVDGWRARACLTAHIALWGGPRASAGPNKGGGGGGGGR